MGSVAVNPSVPLKPILGLNGIFVAKMILSWHKHCKASSLFPKEMSFVWQILIRM